MKRRRLQAAIVPFLNGRVNSDQPINYSEQADAYLYPVMTESTRFFLWPLLNKQSKLLQKGNPFENLKKLERKDGGVYG